MRIVAGKFRGRPLAAPADQRIRPTSDRVREAGFNILAHSFDGFAIEGANVIDLFAGTGALGLEALSRGARACLFVEEDAEARGLIRQNIETLQLTGQTRIYRRDATDLGPAGNREPFSLAFIDPPYGKALGDKALASAVSGDWLAAGALIVLEERAGIDIAWPDGCREIEARTWGDTTVHFAMLDASLGAKSA